MIYTIPLLGCDVWGYLIVVGPAPLNEFETEQLQKERRVIRKDTCG